MKEIPPNFGVNYAEHWVKVPYTPIP